MPTTTTNQTGRLRPLPRAGPARYVRDLIRSAIVACTYPDGRLPSEGELMATYGVTRSVVREALDLLRDEGLIERARRTGTSVVSMKPVYRLGMAHDLSEQEDVEAHRVTNRLLALEEVPAPPAVADALACAVGDAVVLVDRLIELDGEPLTLSTHYLLPGSIAALAGADYGSDFYELVERQLDMPVDQLRLTIEAVSADAEVAGLLGVAEGSPLLLFQRLIFDADGQAVGFGFNRARGDRLCLVSWLRRAPRREADR